MTAHSPLISQRTISMPRDRYMFRWKPHREPHQLPAASPSRAPLIFRIVGLGPSCSSRHCTQVFIEYLTASIPIFLFFLFLRPMITKLVSSSVFKIRPCVESIFFCFWTNNTFIVIFQTEMKRIYYIEEPPLCVTADAFLYIKPFYSCGPINLILVVLLGKHESQSVVLPRCHPSMFWMRWEIRFYSRFRQSHGYRARRRWTIRVSSMPQDIWIQKPSDWSLSEKAWKENQLSMRSMSQRILSQSSL